ncbi:MAG: hypothetical protein CL840_12465 [Crocinitomicaceae bacterium]|nr:hypothetical protein [Crocinitomicaceae bacterium]|tara:strand:+ start:562 stop:1932 length:1371 start_codon:yes stop_codon:yes gene_type:complete
MKYTFLIAIIVYGLSTTQAQEFKNKSYSEHFKAAKLLIANNKEEEAVPVLEELYSRDNENSNVAYLLGLCYVKSFKNINKAIKLLEDAKENYTRSYDRTSLTERDVSEYVYYYLIIAYSLKGDCPKTIETLNSFYKIYSYEDEWYLVDGQKWYRDCGKHKWKEDEDSIVTPKELLDTNIVMPEKPADTLKTAEPVLEGIATEKTEVETPKAIAVAATPVKNIRPYHERLRRVGEAGGPEVMTREKTYTTPTSLYGVQVGAFIRPRFSNDFNGLKNVEVYIDNNGVFRYVIGSFVYRSQAEKLLKYVLEKGYKDAFIVDINATQNYQEEVIRVNNESIKREITGSIEFKVQIGAFKEEIPDDIMKIFLQFDNIEKKIQGELSIFTLGSFSNYEIASAWCQNVKESGVPDAFVIALNEGHKISIEDANLYIAKKQAQEAEKARQLEEASRNKKKKKKK